MKRLPPAKRNQLIIVLVVTVALIGAVYFLLINPQNVKNAQMIAEIAQENTKLQQYRSTVKQMDSTRDTLADLTQQLGRAEADVASGDIYEWAFENIRRFKTGYRVDIPTIGQPTRGDCDLVANLPYKQIRFSLSGTAYYHDLGKFIADFENKFPHCRVLNLVMDPATSENGATERLNFRMDIVALVKPSN